MKWTNAQVEKLKDLCICGVSNKDIAYQLGIDVKEVYAKRSQLGITIDKCKAQSDKPKMGLNKVVKTIFKLLHDELLLLIVSDFTSDYRAGRYLALKNELYALESKYEKLLRGEINGKN